MRRTPRKMDSPGPFRVDQIPPESHYELSNGHAIYCAPSGGRHGEATSLGGQVLSSYPELEAVGVDVGFTSNSGTLRAPDVAVLPRSNQPSWVKGVPPLAIEYADTGQDENDLQSKIADLLQSGTQWIWVVRLTGLRRVEVYTPTTSVRTALPGELLEAPGLLPVPMPVEALYQRDAAHAHTFSNLLRKYGYSSLDAVREEGEVLGLEKGREEGEILGLEKGREEGEALGLEKGEALGLEKGREEGLKKALGKVLSHRGFHPTPSEQAAMEAEHRPEVLEVWLDRALTIRGLAELWFP